VAYFGIPLALINSEMFKKIKLATLVLVLFLAPACGAGLEDAVGLVSVGQAVDSDDSSLDYNEASNIDGDTGIGNIADEVSVDGGTTSGTSATGNQADSADGETTGTTQNDDVSGPVGIIVTPAKNCDEETAGDYQTYSISLDDGETFEFDLDDDEGGSYSVSGTFLTSLETTEGTQFNNVHVNSDADEVDGEIGVVQCEYIPETDSYEWSGVDFGRTHDLVVGFVDADNPYTDKSYTRFSVDEDGYFSINKSLLEVQSGEMVYFAFENKVSGKILEEAAVVISNQDQEVDLQMPSNLSQFFSR
jgi:hypothetical protein